MPPRYRAQAVHGWYRNRCVNIRYETPRPHLSIPEPEAVSIPNHFAIVQRVHAENPQLIAINSKETVKEFYWRAAWALHQHDPNWGMLTKSDAENHQVIEGLRVSVDAVAYKNEKPIVDILSSAGDGPGTGGITWGIDEDRRETNLWIQPPPFNTPVDGPGIDIQKLRDLVKALRNDLTMLQGRISALENGTLRYGAPIILRTHSGNVICAESGGGAGVNATRTEAGPWETFVLEKP
jgi:hypothetical protein